MPLNAKGKNLIKMISGQHGLKFRGISDDGILHYSLTDQARMKAFKSTLRKYKLHYRSEKTQKSEESGIHTMKIRTDRDHQIMKKMRGKNKIKKEKGDSENKKPSASRNLGLLMAGVDIEAFSSGELREHLGVDTISWTKLQRTGFIKYLTLVVPDIVNYMTLLDECSWFFEQIQEKDLARKYKELEKQVSSFLSIISDRLDQEETLDPLRDAMFTLHPEIVSLRKLLDVLCSTTLSRVVSAGHTTKLAFLEDISSHWNTLSAAWVKYREILQPQWDTYADGASETVSELLSNFDIVKQASLTKLVTIQQLLRKSSQSRMAEDLEVLAAKAVEESASSGRLPALQTTKGNWKVYRDICPSTDLPKKSTELTAKFAVCKLATEDKKCPAFGGIRGEYVLCSRAGSYKEGSFFSVIDRLVDSDVLQQLKEVAREDNQVAMLFHIAESRDGKLYFARIADDRVRLLLEMYPRSVRVGVHSYAVYHVAGEPIMLTSEMAVCADKSLLEELNKGAPLPRMASVRTAAVMRMTFTSNARMDKNFVDYMRKLNSVKVTQNTWDVPFKLEEDRERILEELRSDFGYPITIFQVVESPDQTLDGRRYDIYAMSLLSSLAPRQKEDQLNYVRRASSLLLSDKLYDISARTKGTVASGLKRLASNIRVSSCFIIAHSDDIVEEDNSYFVKHAEHTRILAEDGTVVEVVGDHLLDTVTGAAVDKKPIVVSVASADDSVGSAACITIRVDSEASAALLAKLR